MLQKQNFCVWKKRSIGPAYHEKRYFQVVDIAWNLVKYEFSLMFPWKSSIARFLMFWSPLNSKLVTRFKIQYGGFNMAGIILKISNFTNKKIYCRLLHKICRLRRSTCVIFLKNRFFFTFLSLLGCEKCWRELIFTNSAYLPKISKLIKTVPLSCPISSWQFSLISEKNSNIISTKFTKENIPDHSHIECLSLKSEFF